MVVNEAHSRRSRQRVQSSQTSILSVSHETRKSRAAGPRWRRPPQQQEGRGRARHVTVPASRPKHTPGTGPLRGRCHNPTRGILPSPGEVTKLRLKGGGVAGGSETGVADRVQAKRPTGPAEGVPAGGKSEPSARGALADSPQQGARLWRLHPHRPWALTGSRGPR